MQYDILRMHQEKRKIEKLLKKDKGKTRRTTIILEEAEREFVDSLIREGREPGIKPLISKMLDVYRSMMIYDWRFPGEYYCGISRVAFVNAELVSILIQSIPKDKWRHVGVSLGRASRVSVETILDVDVTRRDSWQSIFKRLRVQGFGDFYVKDKYILAKAPFITHPEIWAGLLEGLLNVDLDIKTDTPPFVFEIREPKEDSAGKRKDTS